MSVLDEIRELTEKGHRKNVIKLVHQAVDEGIDSERIIAEGLIPAMDVVSEHYSNSETDILKILSIARCIQEGLRILYPDMDEENNSFTIGTAIVGTIEGDLHDIGKNILVLMFRCNGIRVIDLGVNVTEKQFIKAMKTHPEARIVCMSSLLTTLLPEMRKAVAAVRKADKKNRVAIMLGGSSVTADFSQSVGADYYTESAIECAKLARAHLLALNQ